MNSKCIFCGSINTTKLEEIRSSLNGKDYQLYECNTCSIQFILPNIFEDVYTEGVSNESMNDYVKELHKGRTIIEPPTLEVIKYLLKLKVDLSDKKILDIGAGDGINYLGLKQQFNIQPENYHIIENDPHSVGICKQRGLTNIHRGYFSIDNIHSFPNDFDLVIFTEVFEHQTDPSGFMEAVKKIAKPGAMIIFTVPNREMLKISRSVFYADIPPHHFLRLNTTFFNKNFPDFKKIKVAEYPNPFMILNKERAWRKISSVLFGTEKTWKFIEPLFGVMYQVWQLLLSVKGNGIIVIMLSDGK